jgi:hypothetical protein
MSSSKQFRAKDAMKLYQIYRAEVCFDSKKQHYDPFDCIQIWNVYWAWEKLFDGI